MKFLKFLLLLSIFAFGSLAGYSQLTRDLYKLYYPQFFQQHQIDSSGFETWRTFKPGETKYSLEVGTGFSTFGGGNSFTTSFISPMIAYSPTERLQIAVGGKFSHANFGNLSLGDFRAERFNGQVTPGNPTEAFAYGRYLVNSKLTVYGMGAFGKNLPYMSLYQSRFGTADYQHLSFGLDYKISDKTSIGASFGVTNGPAWGVSPFGGQSNHLTNPFFP
ncbi:MAG: hypothetical protein WBK12_05680 [Tenuifilaceae bacterium]|mgnify:FL=1|nr:hypothetical protein [Bacteroidales bacterium]HNV81971.1 hypothetical protein [Tenuifilaceae bacterium]HPW49941.1 hypothetical protein [Tenuifilaceae bacterium]